MTSTMLRKCLTAAVALAALAAVVALAPVSTAEAGPGVSPFAGTYAWINLPVTISDGGRITGTYSGHEREEVSINGRVRADGSYSFTVSSTYFADPWNPRQRPRWITEHFTSAGNMALDAAGNIVGTPDTGDYVSLFWIRQ